MHENMELFEVDLQEVSSDFHVFGHDNSAEFVQTPERVDSVRWLLRRPV